MRVEKTVSGATTVYIFSGGSVIAGYASGASPSSPQKEYVYAGASLPIAEIDSGSTVKYYEADTLSVRQVTNSSGGVLGNLGQYPYGENWYQSSSQTEFRFTNYLHDSESDNEYAYAREYVNRLARFETLDPAGGSVSDPLSWNRHTYALDNPIANADPDGRDTWVYLNSGQPLDFATDQAAAAALAGAGAYMQNGVVVVDYGNGPVIVGTYQEGIGYYTEAGGLQSDNTVNFLMVGLFEMAAMPVEDLLGSTVTSSATDEIPGLATPSELAGMGVQAPGSELVATGGKAAVRQAVEDSSLSQAVKDNVARAIERAGNQATITVERLEDGSVRVLTQRAGADGCQVVEKLVGADGKTLSVLQKGYDAAGKLVHVHQKLP